MSSKIFFGQVSAILALSITACASPIASPTIKHSSRANNVSFCGATYKCANELEVVVSSTKTPFTLSFSPSSSPSIDLYASISTVLIKLVPFLIIVHQEVMSSPMCHMIFS